jgi:hypothetical protein
MTPPRPALQQFNSPVAGMSEPRPVFWRFGGLTFRPADWAIRSASPATINPDPAIRVAR